MDLEATVSLTDIAENADEQPQDEVPKQASVSEAQDQKELTNPSKSRSTLQSETLEEENVAGEQTEVNGGRASVVVTQEDFKQKRKAERKQRMKNIEETRFDGTAIKKGRQADESEQAEGEGEDEGEGEGEGKGERDAKAFLAERKQEEKFKGRHTMLLEEQYEQAVLREVESDEDAESICSTLSNVSIDKDSNTVQLMANFLNDFDVPSLSDISEDEEVEISQLSKAESIVETEIADVGVFVNPLTGEVIVSTSSTSSEEPLVEENALDMEEEPEECPEITDDEHQPAPKSAHVDESMNDFEQFQETFLFEYLGEEERESDDNAHKHRTEVLSIIRTFLKDLIDTLVHKSETINVEHLIRSRCDKGKLMEELITATTDFFFEKHGNIFLQARIVEYYKRNKNVRVFSRLSPIDNRNYSMRYLDALQQLELAKKRFATSKQMSSFLMSRVYLQLYQTQANATWSETRLEQTVRHYLWARDSEPIKRLVDRGLRLMAVKRNEISDTRFILITMKHNFGRLANKIKQLERVGEDLSINDFISIQNQVVTMDKKIEERNIELKKLRSIYHVDLHLIQHNREKALALADKLQQNKAALYSLLDKQHEMREKLYRLKVNRTKLRKQQQDLSCQGGILTMPSLMYEYDNTVEALQVKRVSVFKLRETLKNLNRRIQEYESSYSV
ncbi:uncharacterized protein LOC117588884 [Drosophila guanche]|uniref:Blast:Coiled-coil domain-containing protein 96 n=1 Tax=Drosophila guanche TaxID=7266 RepID=A0A3B0J3M4_DROGU|nr:uncharacterized protein LOC117588884 [Drosophila guanche]SPP73903.1 blast:Coiled-coil domain-containing protein 96 [Drosophila guanche]